MKKIWKRAAAALCAAGLLFGSLLSCSSGDDDDDNGGSQPETPVTPPKETQSTVHLAKFNAASTEWAASDMIIKGSASSGGKEGYLVLNRKVDLENDDITIEADVKFSSLSGHVGLGFIAVDGSNRKAYSLLTGQNVKNVDCSLGGGGNGLNPAVSWAVGKTYHFKAALSASANQIVYTATDEAGTTSTSTTPIYHATSDVVYPALGGTTAENASYSNIKMTVKNTTEYITYTFDGLDEQDVLSALSVSATSLRLLLEGETTISYTSTAKGENSGVNLDYDNTILTVTDDGNGTLTVKGIKPSTGTTLKVINKGATYITATISVVVEDFNAEDGYGELTTVYPAANAESAFEDGEFRITFDNEPVVNANGSISIYAADGEWVDTIKASDEVISVQSGKDINVKKQMIRVEGNSVYFTPHYGVLEAEKTYYIAIPKDVITAKLNSKEFTGLTNDKDKASWKFTTRAAVSASSTITVDGKEDSTANFRTIHGALLAIGSDSGDYTIEVAPGTYREVVHFNGPANITIKGTGSQARGADTVIQWTNLNKWNGSMDTRAVMYFGDKAGNVVLENITIKNTCDRAVEGTADTQAEAFYYKSTNKVAANNCTFLSHQDTICTKGKAWFYNCYIEGDTDFIWGYSDVALFEKCDLVCLYDSAKDAKSNYSVLFVARTGSKSAAKIGKGYVLLNSTVTVRDGVTNYLGRNAGSGDFYDQIALVNVAFTNNGTGTTSTDLWRDVKVYDYLDTKEDKIGLKFYGLTGDIDTAGKIAHVAEISANDYAKEFNGRRAILNRVYKIEDDAYVAGETYAEDYLSALETAFSAEEDASKGNDYSDEVVVNGPIEFDCTSSFDEITGTTEKVALNGLMVEAADKANFKYDGGNKCMTTSNGIIYVPVTGACTITVKCHNFNSQYIGVVEGETTTALTDAGGTELTYNYTGEAGYVKLTTTTADKVLYIYSIKVNPVLTEFDCTVSFDGQITGTTEKVALNGLMVEAPDSANFKYDGGNKCMTTSNGIIYVPVTGACTITVKCHNFNSQYIGVVEGETTTALTDAGGTELTYNYTGEAGYVKLTTTTADKVLYIYSIKAVY